MRRGVMEEHFLSAIGVSYTTKDSVLLSVITVRGLDIWPGIAGHYRKDCPKVKNQNRRNKARVPDASGKAYVLGGGDANPDVRYAVELADGRTLETSTVLRGCTLGLCWELCFPDLVPLVVIDSIDSYISVELSILATTLNRLRKIYIELGSTSGIRACRETLKETLARERERKVRTTLLMTLPEDHLAKFHKMTNVKEMWEAIKTRFGGNDESKKMQKFQSLLSQLEIHGAGVSTEDANQKFLRSLPSAWSQVSLIMRTKLGVDSLSFDDLYNNLRVFESDVKGSSASSSSNQNVPFVSENTSSTNETEEVLQKDRSKGNQDSRRRDAWNIWNKAKDKGRRFGKQEEPKALVTLDGEGVDWTSDSEDKHEIYALMAYSNTVSYTEEKIRYMKIDLDDKTDVLTYHKKLLAEAEKEKEELKAKVEKCHNSSKNLNILLNSQMSARDKAGLGFGNQMNKGVLSYENEVFRSLFTSRSSDIEESHVNDRYVKGMHAVPPPMTGIYIPSRPYKEIDESQFTYGPKQSKSSESDARSSDFNSCESNSSEETLESMPEPVINEPQEVNVQPNVSFSHLIRDYDFHEKRMAKQAELNKRMCKGTGQKENRPVWNNVQRVNHQNQFVPTVVLTRTGRIIVNTARASSTNNVSTARHNLNNQAVPTKAARKVNAVRPIVIENKPRNNFHKHMTGNKAYLAEYQDYNGGPVAFGGSKGYITGKDTECLMLCSNFKLPNENQVLLRVPRQNSMYSFNLENIVPSGGLACLIAKATIDDLTNWHRRFSWVFFLRTKVETSGILKDFIRQIENQLNKKVKTIQCDNGTEFKNRDMIEFCGSKGIKREYSLKEANHSTGTQDNIDIGNSEVEAESAQDYFVLPIWSSYTLTVKSLEAKNEGEKPNKNTDLKTNEKPVDQEDQVFLEELKRLKRQENEANDAAKALRKEFAQDIKDLLLQAGAARASSTNTVNTTSTPVSTASSSDGPSYTDLTNTDQDDSQIPALEDIYDNPNDGIFTNASYDDEGVVADFTNLETIVNVSLIPTSKIHSIHLSTQILEDPKSAVQTRSKVNKSTGAHAFVSYIRKQRRNNHKDFQHCLFACFLSQIEPKKISKALQDESWVDAMQEELLQFKIQKV
ncbi:ribonuclease H-like domain-containing protein [Tanacetum coccineum]